VKKFALSIICSLLASGSLPAEPGYWPGFVASGYNNEQIREIRIAEQARAIVVARRRTSSIHNGRRY
jgi:hypothetical protein